MASNFHGGIAFHLPRADRRSVGGLSESPLQLTYRLDECTVEAGQSVAGGEPIGSYAKHPVRSSVSGKVTEVRRDDDAILLTLERDGEGRVFEALPFGKKTGHALAEAEPEELIAEIEASGIIEPNGEALIDHVKRALALPKKLRLAAVCCFDLDPLCQTNLSVTEERADAVAGGLTILIRLLRVKDGAMLCDRRFKRSIRAAQKACAGSSLIAIELTGNRYPQANPRLITRWLMEREISAAKTPEDAGLFLVDAETCASLYRLFAEGLPDRTKRLSVFAQGRLKLYDLPYGLPLSMLTERGILPEASVGESLCRGGMDGEALPETVDATLNAIALLPIGRADVKRLLPVAVEENEVRDDAEESADSDVPEATDETAAPANPESVGPTVTATEAPLPIQPASSEPPLSSLHSLGCISCGRCAAVCPMFLRPYDYLPKNRLQKLLGGSPRDASVCIGCGCCSYVCPSRLPLRSVVQSTARKEAKNDR